MWSSARSHLSGVPDGVTEFGPLSGKIGDWRAFLSGGISESQQEKLRSAERTGRPLGGEAFLAKLEAETGRALLKRKPGPKPRVAD